MRLTILTAILLIVPLALFAQTTTTGLPQDQQAALTGGKIRPNEKPASENPDGKSSMRKDLIISIARNLGFVKPEEAVALVSKEAFTAKQITQSLRKAVSANRGLVQDSNYCDPTFVGQTIRFSQTAELVLDDLLYQIHRRFNVNFLAGEDIMTKPINIRAGALPWNTLLKSQLFLSGVRAKCIGANTIELVSNKNLPNLQDTAEVRTKFIKLKYLQPASGGNVDIAGRSNNRSSGGQQSQGCGGGGGGGFGGGGGIAGGGGGTQNCGNFEKLIIEIEKILGIRSPRQSSIGGGTGGGVGGGGGQGAQQTEAVRSNRSVSVVPGRNILVIRATDEEIDLINEIITRADRAPFQVIIRGLIYTANESRLRDVGMQTNIIAKFGDNKSTGSILGDPINTVGSLFDFKTMIGTVDFNVQANALQTKGVISIKSRPFAMVIDGDTADLDVGRQIPVIIQSLNTIGSTPGTLEILEAGNVLSVTPQVIDDDDGKPTGVNLNLQLESNDVDTSVVSQGVPSVNRRSIQTRLLLNQETTVILGGFTVDSASRDVSKTPGLGDIPILGYLFKKKVRRSELNRLYFAISLSVVPYGEVIKPILVPPPGTDIPQPTKNVKKVEEEFKKTGN